MSSECQGEMLDYRRMLMEDFSLSPEIILSCRGEIEHHCSGLHRKGRTLHCLMKVVRGEKGNVGLSCQQAVRSFSITSLRFAQLVEALICLSMFCLAMEVLLKSAWLCWVPLNAGSSCVIAML